MGVGALRKRNNLYGSEDLIEWDFLSNLDFGYECPDLFQLPLDGDTDKKKWVLQDANGTYLVGDFDGTAFKKDVEQDTLVMDVGPDFYAAQTFPAGNLPNDDDRTVQIAWMDHWNGGVGETVWERNATFPVSLGLQTADGQKRVTRKPISVIASLYKNSKTWKAQSLKKGDNPLKGVRSKTFDLTVEFDLTDATATQFGFKIGGKTILYDIPSRTLLGRKLSPDANKHFKIRMLVDWGQLEIFADRGMFSYSEQYAFDPDRDTVELFMDGDLKLISAEFHEIKRIW